MAGLESNREAVIGHIKDLIGEWNFTRAGEERSLGRDIASTVAEGIQHRSIPDAKDPDGGTWPPNEARYAAYKASRYGAHQPNVRTGQMLSLTSLVGDTQVTADEILMRYGTGETAQSSATGAKLSKSDTEISDIEKAWFCSPARPFYALDDEIIDGVMAIAAESLNDAVKETT